MLYKELDGFAEKMLTALKQIDVIKNEMYDKRKKYQLKNVI